jgi:AraC family transcriptional regulator of adaptative response/methylated-DNA-[protein]-cysteine methyltransferase
MEDWTHAHLEWDDSVASQHAEAIFYKPEKNEHRQPLRAFVQGSQFQVRVWRALLQIPEGALVSYSQLAQLIGSPSSARAVGSAVAKNSLAYLIPCHRVIRSTGVLGEYRWGPTRKKAIAAWESSSLLT